MSVPRPGVGPRTRPTDAQFLALFEPRGVVVVERPLDDRGVALVAVDNPRSVRFALHPVTAPTDQEVQVGAGVGLRYLTPFGPLRIDAAVPVNPQPGDPDFAIYAGVGQGSRLRRFGRSTKSDHHSHRRCRR